MRCRSKHGRARTIRHHPSLSVFTGLKKSRAKGRTAERGTSGSELALSGGRTAPLEADFSTGGTGAIGITPHAQQVNRTALLLGRIAGSASGIVFLQASMRVGGDASVGRAVGATQQIKIPRLAHDFTPTPLSPSRSLMTIISNRLTTQDNSNKRTRIRQPHLYSTRSRRHDSWPTLEEDSGAPGRSAPALPEPPGRRIWFKGGHRSWRDRCFRNSVLRVLWTD